MAYFFEYLQSYHLMKDSALEKGFGVRGLCKINRQVSDLAALNAAQRRKKDKSWRKNCSEDEVMKLTIGNFVHRKAVRASSRQTFTSNLGLAKQTTNEIFKIISARFC
jgi:hypothetical protein